VKIQNKKSQLSLELSECNMLVRVAGESLAESDRESTGERCEQFALGLQKFARNRELACDSEVVF
jgi:hypothetical protein